MGKVLRFLREAIGTLFDVRDVVYIAFGMGGDVGALITSLVNIHPAYPISIAVISSSILIYGTARAVLAYKVWSKFDDTKLNDVMRKLLDLFVCLGSVEERVVNANRKKNIKTKIRNKLATGYLDTIGITSKNIRKYLNNDGSINEKRVYKRLNRTYHFKKGKLITVLPPLSSYARLLNRGKLGIKNEMMNDDSYISMNEDLLHLQAQLDVSEKEITLVDDLKELSYGLHSLSVGIRLINESRSWYKSIPEYYINQKDEFPMFIERAFVKASAMIRLQLKRSMLGSAIK